MWKRSLLAAAVCAVFCAAPLWAQRQVLPPGPMQEKARVVCLACHDTRIIVQQQLDRRTWAKVIDKMIRWGAPIAGTDREAMIDYFAQYFAPRESEPADATLAEDPAAGKVRAACLGCHDAAIIVQQQLDRRGWARILDQMTRWGALVRREDRDAILNYLAKHYPAKTTEEKK